jgi:resolvase-like protein
MKAQREDAHLRPPSPGRVVIYTRTATSDPDAGAAELSRQIASCTAHAEEAGLQVVAVERDLGAPGTTALRRPGWDRVVDLATAGGVEFVLAVDFTRFTRSWDDVPQLMALRREHAIEYLTVASSARHSAVPERAADAIDVPKATPGPTGVVRTSGNYRSPASRQTDKEID